MSESKKSYEGVKVLKVRTSYEHSYELPDRITVSLWSRRGLDDRTTVVSNPPRIRLIWALHCQRGGLGENRFERKSLEPSMSLGESQAMEEEGACGGEDSCCC